MDIAYSKSMVSALIRDKSAELGSIEAALSYVRACLQTSIAGSSHNGHIHNVFPRGAARGRGEQLCRCRGMIQEMEPNVSLYNASCEDFFGSAMGGDSVMLEAVVLYVIPVPGNAHFYSVPSNGVENQSNAAGGENPLQHVPSASFDITNDRKTRKRTQCGGREDDGVCAGNGFDCERNPKQWRHEGGGEIKVAVDAPLYQQLNLPHPPMSADLHTACIVTVIQHESAGTGRLKLNDLVDFYGFATDSVETAIGTDAVQMEVDEFEDFGTWHANGLPASFVMHMTCLSWQHVYSEVDRPLSPDYYGGTRAMALQALRSTLCQGDALLAEYVLLHLCARVVAHEGGTPIGDIPLRVEGDIMNPEVWSSYMRDVAPVGEVLLGATQLSDPSLRLTPRQDHNCNMLRTGILQLANGTHITLDSRAVASACAAVQDALFAAVQKQVLLLEYPYQAHELPVDLGFLALSTAHISEEISFLQLAVSVRWMPELPLDAAAPTDLVAQDVRDYLVNVRCVPRRFDSENSSAVARLSERMLSFSRSVPRWNNHDSFIHNNSFAMAAALMRAHAASYGRPFIADEDVEHVLHLESQRVARCSLDRGPGTSA
ncbi:putative Mini chromosome maintenance replisome factor [Trypanosoma vivax]|nr:putative Mini chromosome maintenance replisome factor [Trypanosoma vivax]